MRAVEKTLGLSGMTVLDLPDSGLKEMDPRDIERVVTEHVQAVRPRYSGFRIRYTVSVGFTTTW